MTTLSQLSASQASPEVTVNENFESGSVAAIFGKRHAATSGLTWGYYGGLYNGNIISDGTVTLTNAADNYVVVLRATGVVSVSTTDTNSLDTDYAKLYKVTVAGGVVTAVVDQRADTNGLAFISLGGLGYTAEDSANKDASGGYVGLTLRAINFWNALGTFLSSFTNANTAARTYAFPDKDGTVAMTNDIAGRHAVFISAAGMVPSVTGGCQALTAIASAANQPDIVTLNFDTATQEYAQFSFAMPKSYNEGTVTFAPVWSHAATTTNFGVVFDLQALALSNDDAIAQAFGTAQTSIDTGGTTNDVYVGPESSAITIAGSPAAEDVVFFRISRVTGNGSDTMAVDARLHGIILYITTDAGTDA
jgi:hypothetical protein